MVVAAVVRHMVKRMIAAAAVVMDTKEKAARMVAAAVVAVANTRVAQMIAAAA